MKRKAFLIIIITFLVISRHALAKSIVVPRDYPDIQTAIDSSVEGDTVLVMPGLYKSDINMKEGVDLVATEKGPVVIEGLITGASDTSLEYFTVKGRFRCLSCNNASLVSNAIIMDSEDANATYGIGFLDSTLVKITNNSVFLRNRNATYTRGIYIAADDCELIHNTVRSESADLATGLTLRGTGFVIKDNIFKAEGAGPSYRSRAIDLMGAYDVDSMLVDYNLLSGVLFGQYGANCGVGNLVNIDPCFEEGISLMLKDTSPGINAADPKTQLYAEGIKDMGIYPDAPNVVIPEEIMLYTSEPDDEFTIREKIRKARPGGTVLIAPGAYNLTDDIIIDKNIKLSSETPDNPDDTVINLGDNSIIIMDPYYYKCPYMYNKIAFYQLYNVTLEGITIRAMSDGTESVNLNDPFFQSGYGKVFDGMVREYLQLGYGYRGEVEIPFAKSPICNYSRNLTIRNCKIMDNRGTKASAIYTGEDTRLRLENVLVADNRNLGGGLGRPVSRNGRIYTLGSCVYVDRRASLTLENSTIAENPGRGLYGAIGLAADTYLDMKNSILWSNNYGQDIETESENEIIVGTVIQYSNIQIDMSRFVGRNVLLYIGQENPRFDENYISQNPNLGDLGASFE
ncbi:MAG: hypothetical protein JW800_05115 [Candidatus Omnitrophica bacterium]|nr:hypothetical protein [Candidatus Omnitrophota bacterium]